MQSARLVGDKYQLYNIWFDSTGNRTPNFPHARPVLYQFGHRAWYLSYEASATHSYILLYSLATPKVISGWAPTCDSASSWTLCSAELLGNLFGSTLTQYLIQSHYRDTEETSPCPNVLRLSAQVAISINFVIQCLIQPGLEPQTFRIGRQLPYHIGHRIWSLTSDTYSDKYSYQAR